jgi:proteasome lid subunit RPN8/RPN11
VSFLIRNIEKLNAIILEELQSETQKIQLISIFHSHPSGNHPSATDSDHMRYLDNFGENASKFTSRAFKNLIWLIIDASDYDIKGYIYFENEIQEIEVIVS